MFKIEVLKSKVTHAWFWRIKGRNGEIICHSECYIRRQAAVKTATKLAKGKFKLVVKE